jgi:hypothetical protein
MASLLVETLQFDFPALMAAEKYDGWQHPNVDWVTRAGKKKVDVVALEPVPNTETMWLIEAKDYRVITNPPKPSNLGSLPQTVTQKVNDTLLGLVDTAANGQVPVEKAHASAAMGAATRRVVLHLEPHPTTGAHTALFPRNFTANVYQSLKQLVKVIDPNPLVLNIANTPISGVPWTVR